MVLQEHVRMLNDVHAGAPMCNRCQDTGRLEPGCDAGFSGTDYCMCDVGRAEYESDRIDDAVERGEQNASM